MQPARASWQSGAPGRLSFNNAAAPSPGGLASSNPYKTAYNFLKCDSTPVANGLPAGALSASRPAQSSSTVLTRSPPGNELLLCMDAIQLLLARYPALGPALSTLDWDDHDKLSNAALLRVIKALDGDALLRPHDANPAASGAGSPTPAQTAPQQRDTLGIASSACADTPVPVSAPSSAACAPAAAGAVPATGLTPSAAAPQAEHLARGPTAAAASGTGASTLSDSFAAVFKKLQAAGSISSSTAGVPRPGAESNTAASSTVPSPAAVLAGDAVPAAGPLSVSSAGSSRRTSLRPTLSIDISSIHVSNSSSSSGEDEDEGSDAEPPAPAPHACSSRSAGGPSTYSELSAAPAGNKPAYPFQPTPHPAAGSAQEGDVSDALEGAVAHNMPLRAASSGPAGKKKHCSTPGHALHHDMHIFSNPIAASSSDGEGEGESGDDSNADDAAESAGWAGAAHAPAHEQHMVHMIGCKQLGSEPKPNSSGVLAAQGQHRVSSKPGRKAQTPATGLGQPVSIFSGGGSSKPSSHAAADKPHFAAVVAAEAGEAVWANPQPLLRTRSSPQQQQQQQQQHKGPSWEHKLSKRPPTPGVSLSQPVSIFSGSGSSVETGLAYHSPQHTAGSNSHPADHDAQVHEHLVSFALSSDAGTAVSSSLKTGGSSRQQQLRPNSAPGFTLHAPAAHKPVVTWNKKLSNRPPTPGAALGRPVSIFSGSGGSNAIEDSSGSDSASDSDGEPGQQQQQQHMVVFADEVRPGSHQQAQPARPHGRGAAHATFSDELAGAASSNGDSGGCVPSGRHAGSGSTAAARQGGAQQQQQQHQQQGERHHWHTKLKKRPPTPGVSAPQPVSIFSSSSATHAADDMQQSSGPTHDDSTSEWVDDSHVKFADPADGVEIGVEHAGHLHTHRDAHSSSSSGSGQHGKGGAAARREQSSAAAAAAAGAATDAQHSHGGHSGNAQQHGSWHHKLSKRPPTPGVALSQPVSIFSNSGAHPHHPEGCACDAGDSEGCTAGAGGCWPGEEDHAGVAAAGHASTSAVLQAAPASSTAGGACKGRPQTAPQQQPQHTATGRQVSWGGDNDHDADSNPEPEDDGPSSSIRHPQVPMHTQPEQQHRHNKHHHNPATPGFALKAPTSIFSHDGTPAGDAAEREHDDDDAHISFAEQPVTYAGANKQQQQQRVIQPATERRVSWGNGPEHADRAQGGSSSGTQQQHDLNHHVLQPAGPHSAAAQHATAGSSAGGDGCSSSHAKGRRVSWGGDAGSTGTGSGTSTAFEPASSSGHQQVTSTSGMRLGSQPGQSAAKGVHFRGSDSDSEGGSADEAGSGSTSHHQQQQQQGTAQLGGVLGASAASGSTVAQSSGAGQALTDTEAAANQQQQQQQQQRQHWKGKLAVRPPTPGIGLGQHVGSIFLPDDDDDEQDRGDSPQEAAAHTAAAAASSGAAAAQSADAQASSSTPGPTLPPSAAAAAGLVIASGPAAGPVARGVLARRNPDLAAEAAQQKWQQHLTNRPPTPGASLLQHNMFADDSTRQSPCQQHSMPAPSAVISDSSRIQPGPASGRADKSSSSLPAAAPTAKQALLKLNPELAAEAQQQKWQQHMANRPPTPGASLGHQHNMFADDDAAAGAGSAGHGADAPHSSVTYGLPHATTAGTGTASRDSSSSSSPSSSPGSTSSRPSLKAKQALLKLNPELAAEMQQQQWQQHMASRAPTPGASLLQHNIFADADSAADSEPNAVTGMAGALQDAEPDSSVSKARESTSSSSSSSRGSTSSPTAKQALLKLNPELAAEAQQQKWQQHMANRPPTPGASLGHYHNMFADDGDDADNAAGSSSKSSSSAHVPSAGARVPSSGPLAAAGPQAGQYTIQQQQQQQHGPLPGSAACALVLHNPDLALEKEVQWELKLSKRPPTPAATLGKPINIFADDLQLEQQPPLTRGSGSSSSFSRNGANASLPGAAFGRERSPDQARSPSNSSSGGSTGGRGSPVDNSPGLAAAPHAGAAASGVDRSRPGSSNPGRQRGASPLRNTTTAADVAAAENASPARGSSPLRNTTTAAEAAAELAEQQERATCSPLRHSSSFCDPDPSRMSPLGWRGSSTGPSPSSSTPSSPHVNSPQGSSVVTTLKSPVAAASRVSATDASVAAAPAAVAPLLPASLPAEGASTAGRAAGAPVQSPHVLPKDGTGSPTMRHGVQGSLGSLMSPSGAESQPHSPSRLGRSASPSVSDAAEAGALRRRSASPLSRSSTSVGGAGEGSSNGRHSSPLSRCSSGSG